MPHPTSDVTPSANGAAKEPPVTNRAWQRVLALGQRYAVVAVAAFAFVLLIVMILGIWQYTIQQETTRRLTAVSETLATMQTELAAARAHIEKLDTQAQRLDGQRAALEQLVIEINSGRDEALLIEVERLVNAAANELQLSGNVPAAIAALKSADARLVTVKRPSLLAIRRSIAGDLARLHALPQPDVTGIALRLDKIADSIDDWPMLADPTVSLTPVVQAQADDAVGTQKGLPHTNGSEPEGVWAQVRHWLGAEFSDLVRVRSVHTPESVLLSDAQQQLIRHQLLLRLFDARQALIARNDALYQADLQQAQHLIKKYFDLQKPGPAAALSQINELSQTVLFIEIPNAGLTETLATVASVRAAQDKAGR